MCWRRLYLQSKPLSRTSDQLLDILSECTTSTSDSMSIAKLSLKQTTPLLAQWYPIQAKNLSHFLSPSSFCPITYHVPIFHYSSWSRLLPVSSLHHPCSSTIISWVKCCKRLLHGLPALHLALYSPLSSEQPFGKSLILLPLILPSVAPSFPQNKIQIF